MADKDTDLPTTWTWITFKDAVENISTNNKKIKQKDYLTFGKFPIVDQGQGLIGGYTNDESKVIFSERPLLHIWRSYKNIEIHFTKLRSWSRGCKSISTSKVF